MLERSCKHNVTTLHTKGDESDAHTLTVTALRRLSSSASIFQGAEGSVEIGRNRSRGVILGRTFTEEDRHLCLLYQELLFPSFHYFLSSSCLHLAYSTSGY